jgi:hypothetical protein
MFLHDRSPNVIVEFEDKYCKVGEIFGRMMQQLEADCEKEVPIHEAEEHLWQRVLQMGREMLAAFVGEQDDSTPTYEQVELDGKTLRRLPKKRRREYYSIFGKIEFVRDVYATRETQRQEAIPLDAKLGMPEGMISYLLQRWCNMKSINNSYAEAQRSLLEIFGFAPSVGAMEDAVSRAAEFADEFFDSQPPVDLATEETILVMTSDCKGVPMRSVDAPKKAKKSTEKSTGKTSSNRRLGRVIGGIRQKMMKSELSKKRREDVEKYLNYLAARKAYMKYDEYLAAGYPIGSGVVEGACKHLVKDRMEGSGMRWRTSKLKRLSWCGSTY